MVVTVILERTNTSSEDFSRPCSRQNTRCPCRGILSSVCMHCKSFYTSSFSFHFVCFFLLLISEKPTIRIIRLTVLSFHKIKVELNFCLPNGFNVNISAKLLDGDMSVDAVC